MGEIAAFKKKNFFFASGQVRPGAQRVCNLRAITEIHWEMDREEARGGPERLPNPNLVLKQ